ncbi:polyketide cyclase [Bacillus pseudomycoides]|nr:polyketide cyclase [Bacillus pseudomycoides]
MGRTENGITIWRDFDTVFDLSNQIELWPQLFTEYKEAQIIEQKENEIKFRLVTHPENGKESKTWTSKRIIEKDKKRAIAERIDPKFPFEFMHIKWIYKVLGNDSTQMIWIQEFKVHPDLKGVTEEQMTDYLNKNTKIQMQSVKEKIEAWGV